MSCWDQVQRDDYLVGCTEVVCIYPDVVGYEVDEEDTYILTEGKIYKVVGNVGPWLVSVVADNGKIQGFDKRRFRAHSFINFDEDPYETCEPYDTYKNNKLFGIF